MKINLLSAVAAASILVAAEARGPGGRGPGGRGPGGEQSGCRAEIGAACAESCPADGETFKP
eukprot:CAMPEP_0171462502 /NCGR_PEP_ID=MMETSP0945-20130129/6516_1 /TAXON_ID=109269 /ORGANISM="Vaucheria litorea, Strain CCMP2940" /LENGTH=61 /DNA_ID=CAMNT_0011989045 /DNA_START=88 /DNA_END=269 /DNA_ORIENTATION=+